MKQMGRNFPENDETTTHSAPGNTMKNILSKKEIVIFHVSPTFILGSREVQSFRVTPLINSTP